MKRIIVLSLICLAFLSGCNANSKEKYSEENLINKCGFENFKSEEITLSNTECVVIEGLALDSDSPYKDMRFYVFNSSADAKEAFDTDVNKVEEIYDIEEQSDIDIRYWQMADDAEIRYYEYLSGNLIIKAEINVASCWADEYNETDWIMTKERQERIDWIKTEF